MKNIVQWLPDETVLGNNINNFVVDVDTYGYFLEEVFWKGVQNFIEKKYKIKFKDTKKVHGAEAVENMFYNQELISRHWRKYNKIRDNFYLYKGSIYSYIFIGFIEVGHEIELFRYEMSDLVILCNILTKRKRLFRKALDKMIIEIYGKR